MICQRCCHAADRDLPHSEHCDAAGGPGAKCFCQHRPYITPPPPAPDGCRHCGIAGRGHGLQWTKDAGLHGWAKPTDEQRLVRMRTRRTTRTLEESRS